MIDAPADWESALGIISDRASMVGDSFGIEVALVWPLVSGAVGMEIIAAAGDQDRVAVLPDRVFRHAIRVNADAVVLSHNHLRATGPSDADAATTRRLVAAGHLLGIPLVASLVVEPSGTYDLVTERWWPRLAQVG